MTVRCPQRSLTACLARPGSTRPACSPPEADKHDVMVRGMECRAIFRDDRDRADFAGRLAALAQAGACTVYGTGMGTRPFFPRQGKSLPSPLSCGLEMKARGPGESPSGRCFSVVSYLSALGGVGLFGGISADGGQGCPPEAREPATFGLEKRDLCATSAEARPVLDCLPDSPPWAPSLGRRHRRNRGLSKPRPSALGLALLGEYEGASAGQDRPAIRVGLGAQAEPPWRRWLGSLQLAHASFPAIPGPGLSSFLAVPPRQTRVTP